MTRLEHPGSSRSLQKKLTISLKPPL
uniref:Uncharacterized protein n=1 Tax=Arundo donax TaxID=35708 RepID=A0A0A9F745_ARUDO